MILYGAPLCGADQELSGDAQKYFENYVFQNEKNDLQKAWK